MSAWKIYNKRAGGGGGHLSLKMISPFNPLGCMGSSLLKRPAGGRVLERCWETSQTQEELEVPAHGKGSRGPPGPGQGCSRQPSLSSCFTISGWPARRGPAWKVLTSLNTLAPLLLADVHAVRNMQRES